MYQDMCTCFSTTDTDSFKFSNNINYDDDAYFKTTNTEMSMDMF